MKYIVREVSEHQNWHYEIYLVTNAIKGVGFDARAETVRAWPLDIETLEGVAAAMRILHGNDR